MVEDNSRLEPVWEWLKKVAASERHSFTGQIVDERHQAHDNNLDALWYFAIAGIIRPAIDTQFRFTDEGRRTLAQDASPYHYSNF